ncbi:hypothetical protein IQ07DRAFT_675343 [Pyrenochaeta sp. DS3sAY3a]|nr:hypothetical protein IQ07DRAFT_675343 [Pyrenochaeta sp. DS3sAY3a]
MKLCIWTTMLVLSGVGGADAEGAGEIRNVRAVVTRTTVVQSVITPPPVVHGELFKRAVATCGFVRGNSASPLTCPENYNCISTVRAQPAFACCDSIECLNNWGLCNNFGVSDCNGFDLPAGSCSSIYGSILSCSSEAPYCYRYARSSSLGAAQTYFSYACGTASTDILVLQTATNGANQQTGQTSQTPSNYVISIPGLTDGAFTIPGLTESPLTNPTGSRNSNGNNGNGGVGGSGLTPSNIAMIAVFGGGGIILVVAFVWFCVWRRRSRRAPAARPTYSSAGFPQTRPPPVPQYQQPMNQSSPYGIHAPLSNMRPSVVQPGPPVNKYPTSGIQELGAPVRPLYEMSAPNGGPRRAEGDMNTRNQAGGA